MTLDFSCTSGSNIAVNLEGFVNEVATDFHYLAHMRIVVAMALVVVANSNGFSRVK